MPKYQHFEFAPEDIQADYHVLYYTPRNVPSLYMPKFAAVNNLVKTLNHFTDPQIAYRSLGKVIPIGRQTNLGTSNYYACIVGYNPNKLPSPLSFLSFDSLFKSFAYIRNELIMSTTEKSLLLPVFSDWRFSDVYTGLFTSVFSDCDKLNILTYEGGSYIKSRFYERGGGLTISIGQNEDEVPF